MFQLIVAIISIALIAALAAASIFYGGSAFTDSSLKANVTTLVNGGQQISGAQAIYKTDNAGASATLITTLEDGVYLAAPVTPANVGADGAAWALNTAGSVAYLNLSADGDVAEKVCDLIALQSDATVTGATGADAVVAGGTYGCATDDSFFAFKL